VTTDEALRPVLFPVAVSVYGPFPAHAHPIVDEPDASAIESDRVVMFGTDEKWIPSPGRNPDTEPITRTPPSQRYGFSVHTNATGGNFFSTTTDEPERPDNVPVAVKVYGPFPAHAHPIVEEPLSSAIGSESVVMFGTDEK
jgi:hypothetical protein